MAPTQDERKLAEVIPFAIARDGDSYASLSIDEVETELPDLEKPDELVIPSGEATLVIDYPLSKDTNVSLRADSPKGFTRAGLIREIARAYRQVYAEEEASTEVEVVPVEQREGMINRNRTNGRHGIWGHDLSDLFLEEMSVRHGDAGGAIVYLLVGS